MVPVRIASDTPKDTYENRITTTSAARIWDNIVFA
jgi:hypothetical protein